MCIGNFNKVSAEAILMRKYFLMYTERVNETDAVEPVVCQPWSSRASKMTQPYLDYMGEK